MSAQQDLVRSFVAPGAAVNVGASSVQSAALPAAALGVRLYSTVDCWVEIGDNPTAAANTSTFLPAVTVEYFAAREGMRVAVLRAASDGTLYVRGTN